MKSADRRAVIRYNQIGNGDPELANGRSAEGRTVTCSFDNGTSLLMTWASADVTGCSITPGATCSPVSTRCGGRLGCSTQL